MDFWRFYHIVSRRKWVILAGVLLTTTLTAIGSLLLGRQYEATVTMMATDTATAPAADLASGAGTSAGAPEETRRRRLETLTAILTSAGVLSRVVADLKLDTTPAELAKDIEVRALTADMLEIKVRHRNMQRAGDIANNIIENFKAEHTRIRTGEMDAYLDFLKQQLDEAEKDLQKHRNQIQEFKRRARIAALPEQMADSLQAMSSLENARSTAQAQLEEVQARLSSILDEMARTPQVREVPVIVEDLPEVTALRTEITQLETNLRSLRTRYTDRHSEVIKAKAQLAAAQARLDEITARARNRTRTEPNPSWSTLENNRVVLENERAGLVARLTELNHQIQQAHAEFRQYTDLDVQLASLTQQYNLADQRYAALLTRWQQMQVVSDAVRQERAIVPVSLVGPYNPPIDISRGRMMKFLALALMLSLCGGIAIVVGLDYLDRRLRTTQDAEALMELPVVTVVPRAPLAWTGRDLALCAARHPGSAVAEAYRFLGLHILQHARGRGASVLIALTAKPGQGATATLANLAITLAQADQRVILVDADMRRAKLHRVFGVSNEVGLADLLMDGLGPLDVLQPTGVKNLRLIPAGGCPENPWEVFRSRKMAGLIERLRQHADYVLFNAPSATVFADALSIAGQMDGAILVVRAQETPTGAERQLKAWLEKAAVPVLGVVLNDMPVSNLDSYRYHKYYLEQKSEAEWDENQPTPALAESSEEE